ncbi:MAG: sel1 repeat family protein [Rhodospirillales bacterium]|nr:sel1 repeat family protein [Rhodospirillales bacterium]
MRPALFFALVILLGVTGGNPVYAGFKTGADAALREDFKTALQEWMPLAESGDERAQYNIGLMYEHGRGLPLDQDQALKWYRRAAERGAVPAQHNLGTMYASGSAGKKDLVEAYKWFHIAAVAGFALSIDALKKAPELLSEEEIEKARILAAEWIKNFSPEVGT